MLQNTRGGVWVGWGWYVCDNWVDADGGCNECNFVCKAAVHPPFTHLRA